MSSSIELLKRVEHHLTGKKAPPFLYENVKAVQQNAKIIIQFVCCRCMKIFERIEKFRERVLWVYGHSIRGDGKSLTKNGLNIEVDWKRLKALLR